MVYVDDLMVYPKTARWPYGSACHLMADSLDELHAFAGRIGMKKRWFQNHASHPHYDLTASRRAAAVRLGAKELDMDGVCEFLERQRARIQK